MPNFAENFMFRLLYFVYIPHIGESSPHMCKRKYSGEIIRILRIQEEISPFKDFLQVTLFLSIFLLFDANSGLKFFNLALFDILRHTLSNFLITRPAKIWSFTEY